MPTLKRRKNPKRRVPRPMSREDICNVSPVSNDELYEALKLLTFAAANEQEDIDATRWTLADGKGVQR